MPVDSPSWQSYSELFTQMANTIVDFILPAVSFGLFAGLKPGPLGVFVIHETLSSGFKAGTRASLAPFLTDVPIIAAAFIFLTLLQEISFVLAAISLCGGLYILFLSIRIFKSRKRGFENSQSSNSSFWTAVRLNFLNPGPYLFWFTVGGTYLVIGTLMQSAAFVIFSVGVLVLSKILVAFLSLHFRSFLSSNGYRNVMVTLALLMCAFGLQLIYRAYSLSELGSVPDLSGLK